MNRALKTLGLLLLLAACAEAPPAPVITAVAPGRVSGAAAFTLQIEATGLSPRVRADFDDPASTAVDSRFTATLSSAAGLHDAVEVTLVSSGVLQARFDAGIGAGRYDLSLVDPRGRTAALASAVTVYQPSCSGEGTPCDDGDACTSGERCTEGSCGGGHPAVSCAAADGCHPAGSCDPATGACTHPVAPDGTPCDDRDACTAGESCQAGECGAPRSTVSCPVPDGCHLQGQCDRATGVCSAPARPDDTPCDDANLCTAGERCRGGICGAPTATVTCTAKDQCHAAGSCDRLTGLCSDPLAAEGAPCSDGRSCSTGDACRNGTCTPSGSSCACVIDADCPSLGQCTFPGTCDVPAGKCLYKQKPAKTACDDGDACTTGESCSAGSCGTPLTTVTCSPTDQCHLAGACNAATGLCSNPAKVDGTACSDGTACTTGERCLAGSCGAPLSTVTCAPPDQCHLAGACDPSSGVCSNPPRPDGTACSDGTACTTGETCVAGVCGAPISTVTCAQRDQCHLAGACDPGTGACSNPVRADGASCSDGTACTLGESCQSGVCGSPVTTVSCGALDQCHLAGACDPATGACSNPVKPDGAACSDGTACTSGETCVAGSCGAPTSTVTCSGAADECHLAPSCSATTGLCGPTTKPNGTACASCGAGGACIDGDCDCVNTVPRACLTVSPASGTTSTIFTLDASCSKDLEPGALTYRFAPQGAGFGAAGASPTTSATYPATGVFEAIVEVTDKGGIAAYARRLVAVVSTANEVLVTTAADEADAAATPAAPGGAGLSLREAIAYVNGLNAAKTIAFSAPMTIVLTGVLPPFTANGAALVGRPGVTLDFNGAGLAATCLDLAGAGQRLLGLTLGGCAGTVADLSGAGDQIAECTFRPMGSAITAVQLKGTNDLFGPRNDVSGFGTGIKVKAAPSRIEGNLLQGNTIAVDLTGGSGAVVQGNTFAANVGVALSLANAETGTKISFNVFDGTSSGPALQVGKTGTSGIDVRDNLFSNTTGNAIDGVAAAFTFRDPNGFFASSLGHFSSGAPGATSVLADPQYVDRPQRDFRLRRTSPAVNAGVDLGVDVNGPAAGNFSGAAPDLGATETPY